ncbi:GNAT family N-acetyltransferase [Paraburkholderia susongensis]|uniref:Acetyltransferase (GNAT) domain-containing protein n=1 Tax=Paraburkholderia susongensis TaxID=1515439 RepID=A0A1X7J0K5_9BURK|nr:GNAT family protein [Paraburkholderia susongensis]SMG20705.1 Acetyltransferase (GNAT) domain-containing protein [Paraburkholderia susongensis]
MSDTLCDPMQPTLTGPAVELRPLCETHARALVDAAADGQLWNLKLTVVPGPASIDAYIATALAGRAAGTVMPFVIVRRDRHTDGGTSADTSDGASHDTGSGAIVGSTRFWKIDRANRKLEIGHTWLSESAQRSAVNTEAKYLLLCHAFDTLQCVRVQFTTDELNEKSRAAILRIGAKQEGTVRHERIMPDGRKRNSVRFSIIDDEWPAVKAMLEAKLAR